MTMLAITTTTVTLRPLTRQPQFPRRHTRTFPIRLSSSPTPPMSHAPPKHAVVCGGGVIGVCTAYFLAQKGISVNLIEQSSIACAASGKAGGFLAYDWCDGGPISSLARTSFNLHRSLAEQLNGPQSYGYRPLTTLSLTVDESQRIKTSKSVGELPEWVDSPAAERPREIGTPATTAQVHPGMFTKTLLDYAVREFGVEVVIGRVESVKVNDGGVVEGVVLGDGRVVEADAVVLAMGPWSGKFGMLRELTRVSGLKAHSVVFEPREREKITPHALFLSYYREDGGRPMDPEVYPRPTGEVYICGMSAEAEVPDDPEQISGNPDSIRMLKRVARTVSSHLAEGEAEVKAEQACFLPCTEDSVPIIGELPNVKGCYVATGHSCWGILNGPATGAAVAELVVDGHSSIVDITKFSPARFLRR